MLGLVIAHEKMAQYSLSGFGARRQLHAITTPSSSALIRQGRRSARTGNANR